MDARTQRGSLAPAEVLRSDNSYCTRSWDTERASRYVFEIGGRPVEASHFGHFSSETAVKQVIELPLGFGCPVGCRHCASALLKDYRPLSTEQLVEMFKYILNEHTEEAFPRLRVALAGTGEGSLLKDLVSASCVEINAYRPDASFMLTTVGRDASYIGWVGELADQIPIDYLLVTYLHYDPVQRATIVPSTKSWPSSIDELVSAMARGPSALRYRVNYVVISRFNDTREHTDWLARKFDGMQERVTFRVSRLNDTPGTELANLQAPSFEVLEGLRESLSRAGFKAYSFASRRNDDMNCGQLACTYQRLKRHGEGSECR